MWGENPGLAVLGEGGLESRASGCRWRGELSAHHGDRGMPVGGLKWPFLWASLHLSLPRVGDLEEGVTTSDQGRNSVLSSTPVSSTAPGTEEKHSKYC